MKRKTAKLWAVLLAAALILHCGISPLAVGATTLTDISSEEEVAAADDSETEETSAAEDANAEETSSADADETSSDDDSAEASSQSDEDADTAVMVSSVMLTTSVAASEEESDTETAEVLVVIDGKFIETTWAKYNDGSYVNSDYTESTALSETLDMDIIFVGENYVTIEGSLDLGEHIIYGESGAQIYLTGDDESGTSAVVTCGGIEASEAYLEMYVSLVSSGDVSVSFMDFRGSTLDVDGSLYANSDCDVDDGYGYSGYFQIIGGSGASVNITGSIIADEETYIAIGADQIFIGGDIEAQGISMGDAIEDVTIGGSINTTEWVWIGNDSSTTIEGSVTTGYLSIDSPVTIKGDVKTSEGLSAADLTIEGNASVYNIDVWGEDCVLTIGGNVVTPVESDDNYIHVGEGGTLTISGNVTTKEMSTFYETHGDEDEVIAQVAGASITVGGNVYLTEYLGVNEYTEITVEGDVSASDGGCDIGVDGKSALLTIEGSVNVAEGGVAAYNEAKINITGDVDGLAVYADSGAVITIEGNVTMGENVIADGASLFIGSDVTTTDFSVNDGAYVAISGSLTVPQLDVWNNNTVQVGGDVTANDYIHVGDAGTLTIGGDVTTDNISTSSTVWDDEGNETDETITGSYITISGSLTASSGMNVETGTSITVNGNVTLTDSDYWIGVNGADACLTIGGNVTVENGGIEVSDGAVASISGEVTVGYSIFVSDSSLLVVGESSLTEDTDGGTVSINGQTVTAPSLNCNQLHLSDAILTLDVQTAQIYVYSDSAVNGAWEYDEGSLPATIFCYEGGILCNTTSFNSADCVENSDATWYFYTIDELADVLGIEIEASTTYTLSCDDPAINDVEIVIDENGSAAYTTYLLPENVYLVSSTSNTDTDTQLVVKSLTAVPEGLKEYYDSVDSLTEDLISRVTVTEGYVEENTSIYDVKLQYRVNGGEWVDATEDNFPSSGITVALSYPDGTDSSYDFIVMHMFTVTSERLGTTARNVEFPAVTKTEDGLVVTLNGLSPVVIAWLDPTTVLSSTEEEETTDTSTEEEEITVSTVETTTAVAVTSADTGDEAHLALWTALLLIACGSLTTTVIRIRRKQG